MSNPHTNNRQYLRNVAYKDASRLNARIDFWRRYGSEGSSWNGRLFDLMQLPEQARILELGCGPGHLWSWASHSGRISPGWEITLTDLSEGMLADAQKVLGGISDRFNFRLVDAVAIPFEDASFDAVIANHMLYHVSDLERAVGEIARVLKHDGHLYALTNGSAHIKEMIELQRQFALDEDEAAGAGAAHETFTVEAGTDLLRGHFSTVEVNSDQGIVEVDDPAAITAYVASMSIAVSIDALEDFVRSRIAAAGFFAVTRSSGLLVAVP